MNALQKQRRAYEVVQKITTLSYLENSTRPTQEMIDLVLDLAEEIARESEKKDSGQEFEKISTGI